MSDSNLKPVDEPVVSENETSSVEDITADMAVMADVFGHRAYMARPIMVSSHHQERKTWKFELVDSSDKCTAVADILSEYSEVALDAEGIDLSRIGKMTVLTIKPVVDLEPAETPAYVFDLLALYPDGNTREGGWGKICDLLESDAVLKIMFDCRSDSDALWHQYQVRLSNVLDCQVFDQGCRWHQGERRYGQRFVPGMEKLFFKYFDDEELRTSAPHRHNKEAWNVRPMTTEMLQYAANDCHKIDKLVRWMRGKRIADNVMEAVKKRCEENLSLFRDRREVVTYHTNRTLVMTERPLTIIASEPK